MSYLPPLQNNESYLCSVQEMNAWIFLAQFRLREQSKDNAKGVELGDRGGTLEDFSEINEVSHFP